MKQLDAAYRRMLIRTLLRAANQGRYNRPKQPEPLEALTAPPSTRKP